MKFNFGGNPFLSLIPCQINLTKGEKEIRIVSAASSEAPRVAAIYLALPLASA